MINYEIIINNKIVGIASDNNFKYYNTVNKRILPSTAQKVNFISFASKLYHASWMSDIPKEFKQYEIADVIEITEDEAKILLPLFNQEEIVSIEIKESPYIESSPVVIEDNTNTDLIKLNFIKEEKIKELSHICNKTIESGIDVDFISGTEHFSLTTQDQLNLISLQAMVNQGALQIPYHADGKLCKFYTPAEITTIIDTATKWKTYHTTYYNALKNYVNSLDDVHAIANIEYGIELPEEYQSDVLKSLNANS